MIYEILSEYKHINTTDENGYKAVYTPDMDVSAEDSEIKDLANQHWTQEVKDAWEAKLASEVNAGIEE
tara:strand:- start:711 stop:914 length:204 start_codon:yes stop_codon:yes gene_type:complete